MSINLGYFLRESSQNFRRNWVMSIGAVITIFLSLLLVGVSIAVGVMVGNIVESVESKVTIQVFLKDGAATEDVQALQQWIDSDGLVKTVQYTSKDEALKRFREQMKGSEEIVDQLETNPLPASLDVELEDPRRVEEMATKIQGNKTFAAVAEDTADPQNSLKYGQKTVEKLFAFTQVLRVVFAVFIAMLAVVSLIFINNTIRLAIYARRKEIGIMRLVGASNWFIRTPFLLEGVFQALIGALLAILFLVGMQAVIVPRIGEALPFLAADLQSSALVQISLILVVAGVFIGLIGSGMALRRYLRV